MSYEEHSMKELASNSDMSDAQSPYLSEPNKLAKLRNIIRQPLAEFFGMSIFVFFGVAGNCQGVLFENSAVSSSSAGGWLSVASGWGFGLGAGILMCGSISGGHLNPAVTLTLAIMRKFCWRKVLPYILAQFLGAFFGSLIAFGLYQNAISLYEGGADVRTVPGTASLFGTYPASSASDATAFFQEFIGAFLLVAVICAVCDIRNGVTAQKTYVTAAVVGITLFFLGMTIGPQTGFAFNPARDFAPRVVTAMVGYGKRTFTYRNQYWLWGGIIAPILGAISGGLMYNIFVCTGSDAVMNTVSKNAWKSTPVGANNC